MNKRLKRVMILSGSYIVLMTILLVGVSTAKYTKSQVAYSSFGTAGYNVLLIGQDPETGAYTETEGSIENFGKTLLGSDYVPGMTYSGNSETNTAKVFPFQVANGTSEEDASDVAFDYTIKLRTTRNLPLSYKLLLGSTVYTANSPQPLDKDGNVVTTGTPQLDANGIAWYEWTFRDIGNTGEGTGEVSASPVFSLCGGEVDSNSHAIIVEWPITVDSATNEATGNEQKYMKEIELLEVRVTSVARNNTTAAPTEEGYTFTERDYSQGYILLDPAKDVQTYEVDYRAFKNALSYGSSAEQNYNAWQYDFVIDNGNGLEGQTKLTSGDTKYKVSILAPLMKQDGDDGDATGSLTYEYSLFKEDRTEEEPAGTGDWTEYLQLPCSVWKYDVSSGEPDSSRREDRTAAFTNDSSVLEEIEECSTEGSNYRYYREQRFGTDASTEAVFTLENTETVDDVTVAAARQDTFHLEIRNASNFPSYLQLYGKLRIVIEKVN